MNYEVGDKIRIRKHVPIYKGRIGTYYGPFQKHDLQMRDYSHSVMMPGEEDKPPLPMMDSEIVKENWWTRLLRL